MASGPGTRWRRCDIGKILNTRINGEREDENYITYFNILMISFFYCQQLKHYHNMIGGDYSN